MKTIFLNKFLSKYKLEKNFIFINKLGDKKWVLKEFFLDKLEVHLGIFMIFNLIINIFVIF